MGPIRPSVYGIVHQYAKGPAGPEPARKPEDEVAGD